MAAPAINRLVLTDDDGTGMTGTPLNNALFQDLQNRIDKLSNDLYTATLAAVQGSLNGWIAPLFPPILQNLAAARTITYNDAPAVWRVLDPSLHDVMVLNNQAAVVYIGPPLSSNAGGVIAPRDEQSIVYRIRDGGTPQPIVWNTGAGAWPIPMTGIPLPSVTLQWQTLHVGMRYSALHAAWFVVAQVGAAEGGGALDRGDLLRAVIDNADLVTPKPGERPEPKIVAP